jgi:hypothetical protein
MNTTNTIKIEIKLQGEIRLIEFRVVRPDLATNSRDFAGRIGNGEKVHAVCADAWLRNGKWELSTTGYALNRRCHITQFRDTVTSHASAHTGSQIAVAQ